MTTKIKSMIERFRGKLFYNSEEIDLHQAEDLLSEARQRIKNSMRERELLEVMAHTITGCVWIKSFDALVEEHTYEFANLRLCERFLCLEDVCLEDCTVHVRGRTDFDLINDFIERCGQSHTFSELCEETDHHAVEQAVRFYHTHGKSGSKTSRYLEYGIIGNRTALFNVTKTPLFKSGEKPCWNTHTYLVGTATEEDTCCDAFYKMSKDFVAEGKAELICPGAVWLYPNSEVGECTLLEKDLKGEI